MVLAGGTVTIHNDQLKQVMLFAVGPDGDFSIDSWHHDPGSCRAFGLDSVFGTGPGDLGYRLAGVWVSRRLGLGTGGGMGCGGEG